MEAAYICNFIVKLLFSPSSETILTISIIHSTSRMIWFKMQSVAEICPASTCHVRLLGAHPFLLQPVAILQERQLVLKIAESRASNWEGRSSPAISHSCSFPTISSFRTIFKLMIEKFCKGTKPIFKKIVWKIYNQHYRCQFFSLHLTTTTITVSCFPDLVGGYISFVPSFRTPAACWEDWKDSL